MNRQEAMERIKARRSRAEYQARRRRSELIERDEIARELLRARWELNREVPMHLGDPAAMEAFSSRYLALGRQLEARLDVLLRQMGLEEGYLLPAYTCPVCEDTGLRADGSACGCLCALMLEGAPMGVGGEADFSTFDAGIIPPGEQRENTLRLKEELLSYAADFGRGSENLLLRGKAGLGKSFLMGCTARAVNQRGYSVLYLSAYEMLERFRQKHFTGEDAVSPMMTVDFLVLDDLGTEPMFQNITVEYLFAVLNARGRDRLPYAVVTNLTPEELSQRYGERVLSRLLDRARLFSLSGRDLRILLQRQNQQEGL